MEQSESVHRVASSSPHVAGVLQENPPPPLLDQPVGADGFVNESFEPSTARRAMVLFIICVTVAVTIVAVFLIYYRWVTVSEPTSFIVVEGDDTLGPVTLTVASSDHPLIKPPDLTAENKFLTPVLLHPGTYILTVKTKDDERVVFRRSFVIEPHKGMHLPLPTPARRKAAEEEAKQRTGGQRPE